MDSLALWGYPGLFFSGLLAGSIVPASSEVVLTAALMMGLNKWMCLFVLSIGNLLGGMTCYYMGYLGKMDWIVKYLKINPEKLHKMQVNLDKRGTWLAAFAFVPILGNIMIVTFGLMRSNFYAVSTYMFIGKVLRYFIWMALTLGVFEFFDKI
ncbi:MAG: VTT domain-containing protein [Bacteroidales bacterium]